MEMVKRLQRRRQANMMSLLLLVVVVIMASSWMVEAATELTILQPLSVEYDKLPHCNMTTVELAAANSSVAIAPCILYDTQPTIDERNDTHVITVVGVFPSMCDKHRDGAVVAVEQINSGLGAKIGYYGNHHLQIRLVVAIAGNSRQLEPEAYEVAHQDLLESMLLSLNPQYILGSCSFYAALDKPLAERHQTMVLSQVGPDKFYEEDSNDYVFGVHVRSETYGLPALYALKFAVSERRKQKIRIVHRDRSEFFYSTCRAVYDRALSDGFTSATTISYNPEADHDGDGISNQEDVDFLEHIGDRACAAEEANDGIAIWACVLSDVEANALLQKWKTNGCRLSSLWMTVASWEYPHRYPELVPHMQSGGQWHKKMTYSDEFFESGQHMLDYASDKFGYTLPYGALGAYHAIYLMYQNTASFVKAKDVPDIAQHYSVQYEEIRRNMLGLTVPHSLYGPTSFNAHRRNVGRGSAGMQWGVPFNTTTSASASGSASDYELLLVSPTDQAEATVVVPAPAASACPEGHFVNQTRLQTEASLLADKCSPCPVDTFRIATQKECQACPNGSSTEGATGATICIRLEENMIPTKLLVFGYVIMGLVFSCAIGFGSWAIRYRNDPVVQLGQLQFLLLICLGSIISSSSIIPLSIQAGALEGEDTTAAASLACQFIPWLYSTGWILEYSSLLAKSYRMYIMMQGASTMRRVTVKMMDMAKIVVVALLINWAIVIPWTIVDPLTWEREDLGNNVEEGLLTQESIGKCTSDNTAAWLGSLLCFHLTVMIASNVLLWQLRTMSDRYQESKYVTLASVFASEFLILGVPILFAVGDSSTARHLALTCIIGFSDLGILLMIFVPKIKYQRKGLPEGTTVGKSIMKNTKITQPHEVLGRSFASSFSADQMQSLRMSSLTQDYHQSVAGGSLCLQCSASLLDKSASSNNANTCGGVLRFSSAASVDNNKASTELRRSSAVPTASPTTSEQAPIVSDIEGDIIDGSMDPHHRTTSAGVALTKD